MHVELTCVRAEGVRSADCWGYGTSDPFCVVFRDGKVVGRTKTINNNNSPEWKRKHKNLFKLDNVPTMLEPKKKKSKGGDDDEEEDDEEVHARTRARARGGGARP